MEIEISLTRALAKLLKLDNLKPSLNKEISINHFYADIITRNRQKTVIFFNTLNSWMSLEYLRNFRKNPLEAFKESIRYMLTREEIKPYIIDKYLGEITSISFSLTNNKSTVARMSSRKKDLFNYSDRFIDPPDAKIICEEKRFNSWICKNPFSSSIEDSILPYGEMGYYLINKYIDLDREEIDHETYFDSLRNYSISKIPPLDLSRLSDEEIEKLNKSVNEKYFLISIPRIRSFYKEHPFPSREDYFAFIYSLSIIGVFDYEEEMIYIRLFNLNYGLYSLYKRYFNRVYESRLKEKFNLKK